LTTVAVVSSVQAADDNTNDIVNQPPVMMGNDGIRTNQNFRYEHEEEATNYYRANEISADVFGTAAIGSYTVDHLNQQTIRSVRQNTSFGIGAGVNYFVTRRIGIGAEAYSRNLTGIFVESASANLTFRLPLGQSGFAPYIMGGGGHQFDEGKYWFGQSGGGLENRFCKNIGFFVDARVVWPNETKA
jgi:hypothetical protein